MVQRCLHCNRPLADGAIDTTRCPCRVSKTELATALRLLAEKHNELSPYEAAALRALANAIDTHFAPHCPVGSGGGLYECAMGLLAEAYPDVD